MNYKGPSYFVIPYYSLTKEILFLILALSPRKIMAGSDWYMCSIFIIFCIYISQSIRANLRAHRPLTAVKESNNRNYNSLILIFDFKKKNLKTDCRTISK